MASKPHLQAVAAQQEDDMIETKRKTLPINTMDVTELRMLAGQLAAIGVDIKLKNEDRLSINRDLEKLRARQEALSDDIVNATKPVECDVTMDWRHNKVIVTPLDKAYAPFERTMTTEEAQRSIPTGEPDAEDLEDLPEGEEPAATEDE